MGSGPSLREGHTGSQVRQRGPGKQRHCQAVGQGFKGRLMGVLNRTDRGVGLSNLPEASLGLFCFRLRFWVAVPWPSGWRAGLCSAGWRQSAASGGVHNHQTAWILPCPPCTWILG